jgi:NitT/TauT family transport system substrate-binding protein
VVETIVEAFLATWRQMVANPAWVEEERARRNLLADRPKELLAGVEKFYRQGVEAGMFSADGGGATAARADFEFYTEAGQLQGPASSLAVEEFWDLGPLEAARKKLGA